MTRSPDEPAATQTSLFPDDAAAPVDAVPTAPVTAGGAAAASRSPLTGSTTSAASTARCSATW